MIFFQSSDGEQIQLGDLLLQIFPTTLNAGGILKTWMLAFIMKDTGLAIS